jgi:TonB family protein
MRDSKHLKRRLTILFALGLPLLACFVPLAPVRSQDAGQPKVVASHAPSYTPLAAAARVSGKVVVEVKIDALGRVSNAKAKGGHPLLQRAAEESAARWSFEPAPKGESERTATLTFDFMFEASCDGTTLFRSPYYVEVRPSYELSKVSDTANYIPPHSANRHCPVHGLSLKEDKVEIIYGLVMFKPGYLNAEKRHFPYANTAGYGGCVIHAERNPCNGEEVLLSPTFARVLYCPKCRAAKQRWTDAHPWRRG